jgi:hypothetical protein
MTIGQAAMPPTIPAQCETCHKPLERHFYRFQNRTICGACAQQIAAVLERNRFAGGPWGIALLAGFGTAIAAAIAWAAIAKWTHYRGGLVAIFMGVFVTSAMYRASGGRRGAVMQISAITIALFGIWLGKGLLASWAFYDEALAASGGMTKLPEVARHILLLLLGFLLYRGFFDVIVVAFIIWDGVRRLRPIRVQLEGPFPLSGGVRVPGLQFDTVEAAAPNDPRLTS